MIEYAKDVRPAKPEARKLAIAIICLINANKELSDAERNTPSYTAQYEREDFYADEQETWNRAADALFELISVDSQKN